MRDALTAAKAASANALIGSGEPIGCETCHDLEVARARN
jgi:hypothetical protein